jgi:nucleoside-diphosphate-sugar epimerase
MKPAAKALASSRDCQGPLTGRVQQREGVTMTKQVIAVLGGTGAQGGGVVDALLKDGQFRVPAAVRNPDSEGARSLARRGCEVVQADILDAASIWRNQIQL